MTSEAVRQLVEREIAGNWDQTNAHGCDLRRCLVTPVLTEYRNLGVIPPADPPGTIWLWLVLDESPEDRSGYKIVFDEEAEMFGLAFRSSDGDVFLGYYGSFLNTYAGM
jgi:hypothetical protein